MKIIKNNYQKTLGFTKCAHCGSILCIQNTDRTFGRVSGKATSFFVCGACEHKQAFMQKDLTSRKKSRGEDMKKIITILLIILIAVLLLRSACIASSTWTERQTQAHEIAETARAMGLPEDNPIIAEAQRIWEEEQRQFILDRDIIATVIYNEAWAGCTDRHRELVAAVIINRVKSDKFPDTVYDVVSQKGQYLLGYANGDPRYTPPLEVREECQEIAARALLGAIDCPDNVLYQAEFKQGSGVYEVCETSYSTTYFCYG